MLTHMSLFTGVGGIDLAAEWAGFTTIGQCEWADYPTKVLEKHWPDVPRWRDIRDVTAESFFEKTGFKSTTVISGGFPCQPFSLAGNRKGKKDDRYLWPEMLRVISELKPTWVIGENVAGIVSMAEPAMLSELDSTEIGSTTENMLLEEICQSIENIGYKVQPIIIPAASVGAPHRRERTFIVAWDTNCRSEQYRTFREMEERENSKSSRVCTDVAYSNSSNDWRNNIDRGLQEETKKDEREAQGKDWERMRAGFSNGSENVSDANEIRCRKLELQGRQTERKMFGSISKKRKAIRGNWDIEPDVGRVANGISNRVDRLKCLGNAVVPQQVYPILQAIANIENERVINE